jgi:hypothetical protein
MKYTHQTAPRQFLEANGIRFAYRRFGKANGVPLVFNQHYLGTMDYWIRRSPMAWLASVATVDGITRIHTSPTLQGAAARFAPRNYKIEHASLNGKRGSRGCSVPGSPYPRLQRKFDLTCPSGKNS